MDNKIKSALDAAGTAADYSARATYQRGYDAGIASVEARANAAEELAELYRSMGSPSQADLAEVARERDRHAAQTVKLEARAEAAEARAEKAEAENASLEEFWKSRDTSSQLTISSAIASADAAEALVRERTMERDNYGQELDKAIGMVEMHVDDAEAARILWRNAEKACALMDAQRAAAEAREWALGVQVVAQAARLRLAESTIEALRDISEQDCPDRDTRPTVLIEVLPVEDIDPNVRAIRVLRAFALVVERFTAHNHDENGVGCLLCLAAKVLADTQETAA